MSHYLKFCLGSSVVIGVVLAGTPALAQEQMTAPQQAEQNSGIGDIVVTARQRSESLQRVPDAISAFSQSTLVNANIKNVTDLSRLTPNLNFRDGRAFSANFFDIRMRGIGSAQGGWPSVSLIVDGVPTSSSDALTAGSLAGVERIEVLRGPQSALYGFNAIAGAINIVTKRPTNDFTGEARVYYGNGDDLQASAAVSGALIADKVLLRISGQYRDDDGRINSQTNGVHLDFHNRKSFESRLILVPTERFEADIRTTYDREHGGYSFQGRGSVAGNISDVINTKNPVFARREPGTQTRTFGRVAARLKYDADIVELSSVTSYDKGRQHGVGSACYDDVNAPSFPAPDGLGGTLCLANTRAFGNRAAAGQVIERFQAGSDDIDAFFQDVRIASKDSETIEWLVGGSGLWRRVDSVTRNFNEVAGTLNRPQVSFTHNRKYDKWWGVYGQISAHLGNFELTANGRYDRQKYKNTSYADFGYTNIIRVPDQTGVLQNSQHERAHSFQPKGQISYKIDETKMVYVTASRGFRAGYFNVGSFAIPEKTTNYEAGFKTSWFDRKLVANASVFHIDYSNQQLFATTNVAPFRIPVTVPKTRIKGAELETSVRIAEPITLSATLAYLDADVTNGTTSPRAPKWSGSFSGQVDQPLNDVWTLNARADMSWHSAQFLAVGNTQRVPKKQYLNARIGVEREGYGVYFVGQNLTNTQEPQIQASATTPYRIIYPVDPRSYGVELRVQF
ncbi:iron complex outermembrane receptor protein [Sphingobium sp. JAI105]|uniref:TonB-dependent receptor n=1 Tax=Sphingobium sp. JAI105 TaxID=2787715 RepID=UPI0018C8FAF6|nr:TonB-dependent receptor [Sphingobium sp. JAI105]MBG6118469.1 iron complex outermembrane receptor protein [Sphingobium sp. JAI105]